jgi:hypothetical protein
MHARLLHARTTVEISMVETIEILFLEGESTKEKWTIFLGY